MLLNGITIWSHRGFGTIPQHGIQNIHFSEIPTFFYRNFYTFKSSSKKILAVKQR